MSKVDPRLLTILFRIKLLDIKKYPLKQNIYCQIVPLYNKPRTIITSIYIPYTFVTLIGYLSVCLSIYVFLSLYLLSHFPISLFRYLLIRLRYRISQMSYLGSCKTLEFIQLRCGEYQNSQHNYHTYSTNFLFQE